METQETFVQTVDVPTRSGAEGTDQPGGWELVRQIKRAWRLLRFASIAGSAVVLAVLVLEIVRYYDLFANVHWSLGVMYLVVVAALLGLLVGLPIYRFCKLPTVVRPPDVHLSEKDLTSAALAERAHYVVRYLRSLKRNDELQDRVDEIESAEKDATALWHRVQRAGDEQVTDLADELKTFERQRVDTLLKALDDKVDRYIRSEAVTVGLTTTVVLSGAIDALIVLWRNANMISQVARFYYGRPHLRGTLCIMRDVLFAALVGLKAQSMTDHVGTYAARTVGAWGRVAGPLLDGSINGLVTLKVGYLAKRRCRSFEAWTEKTQLQAIQAVMKLVGQEAFGVVSEMVKRAGGVGSRAAAAAGATAAAGGRSVVDFVKRWFGGKADDQDAAEASA